MRRLLHRLLLVAEVTIVVPLFAESLRSEARHFESSHSLRQGAIVREVLLEHDVQLVRNFLKVSKQFEDPVMRLLLYLEELAQGVDYDFCVLLSHASFEV